MNVDDGDVVGPLLPTFDLDALRRVLEYPSQKYYEESLFRHDVVLMMEMTTMM